MSIMKDLFMEEYDRLESEAQEAGHPVHETKLSDLAMEAAKNHFFAMCDEAKDRAKYEQRF